MSVSAEIRERVKRLPKGTPFTPKSFLDIGGRSAVDKALARLAQEGSIDRVNRGVYARPKPSRYFGKALPATSEIVQAIARANGETISVHGAEALRELGLTTQTPVRTVFLTTGRSRSLNIAGRVVELQHTKPAYVRLAGTQVGSAIAALLYLGRERVTEEVVSLLKKRLSVREWSALEAELPRLPSWLATAVHRTSRIKKEY